MSTNYKSLFISDDSDEEQQNPQDTLQIERVVAKFSEWDTEVEEITQVYYQIIQKLFTMVEDISGWTSLLKLKKECYFKEAQKVQALKTTQDA